MKISRDAMVVVNALGSALAAATIANPKDLRAAINFISSPEFNGHDEEEWPVVAEFISLLELKLDRKEELLQKAFGGRS